MKTSEILAKAADLIEQRGWSQGWYCDDAGSLCATGAILAAAGIEPEARESANLWATFDDAKWADADRAWRVVDDVVNAHTPAWNDARGRTAAEVVAALRGAAEAARAET